MSVNVRQQNRRAGIGQGRAHRQSGHAHRARVSCREQNEQHQGADRPDDSAVEREPLIDLVRHNLAPPAWAAGISAFTIVFAAGQIVGPTLVGWVADGRGLLQGLAVSAGLLLLGSLIALAQRHLRP